MVELQNIYAARQQVFALEQQCIYLDVDGHDEDAWHLAAWAGGSAGRGGRSPTHACSIRAASMPRLDRPGADRRQARGTGLGRELVARAIAQCDAAWPEQGIRISAQSRLERFYAGFGFEPVGARISRTEFPTPKC